MKSKERLQALNQVLKHCKSAPFYRNRIPDRPLTSFEEIKKIPLTTKEELRRASPFGLICVPGKELYQYHESFGTTGRPVSTWWTRDDFLDSIRVITECGINFSEDDTVLIRFPYAISSAAHMVHAAAQLNGACVIPAGSRSVVSPFPRIINMLQRLEVTVLACLPLQALLLAETAEMLGFKPDRDFPKLRAIFTAGETLTPGRRQILESIWGVPVFNHYGMTETGAMANDCEFGRLHSPDNYFITELLKKDLKTEVKPGETGYLVVTTLKKRAAPVIRYLTGDRAKLVSKDCPCGKKLYLEIRGREEDSIAVGGQFFDLWDLEDIVSRLPCRRFWVAGPGHSGLRFVVEEEKEGDFVDPGIIRVLESKCNVQIKIEIVPKGTLYDRGQLITVGVVGKPRYVYSAAEMEQKAYFKSAKT